MIEGNHFQSSTEALTQSLLGGAVIVLGAALVWGIGNAVAGFTAHKYVSSGSLFPAVDIALANTFGGLVFLTAVALRESVVKRQLKSRVAELDQVASPSFFSWQTALSGSLKGANTCLFLFSATYIAATQSTVLESTYILWSLAIVALVVRRGFPLLSTGLKALLVFAGVVLVSGPRSLEISGGSALGALFGVCAGISYALYLASWASVTERLTSFTGQLLATRALLVSSFATIIVVAEITSIAVLLTWWVPFTHLSPADVGLQMANGVFVIGIVYLLVTVGMARLKDASEGASFLAALCLSFSIPFTLLPEFIIGRFVPTGPQLVGVALFMIGFLMINKSLSEQKNE